MIVSLVKFFGSSNSSGQLYTDRQRTQLLRWFWRSCMERLRADEKYDISTFRCEIMPTFFTENQFNINTVNTKTFIAMLASNLPVSFISGAKVDLTATLKQSSSKEFHHIFPDKYLQRQCKKKREIYQLANFCFLNNADNQKIKDKSPKEYFSLINQERLHDILSSALCPNDTASLAFEDFISKRVNILVQYAKELTQ